MLPETFGQIIVLSLQLWLKAMDHIPKERHEQNWERFFQFIDSVEKVFKAGQTPR
jgi:hypothetical protein